MSYSPLTLFNGCPTFFRQFNNAIVSTDTGRAFGSECGVKLKQTGMGLHFVDGIQGAASKWRLSRNVVGLSFDTTSDVSMGLMSSYSAQVRVALSVVAFEAVSRMFRAESWPDTMVRVFTDEDNELCTDCRLILNNNVIYSQLFDTAKAAQKVRLEAFMDGNNDMLYQVCVSIRNAFSHGNIGGKEELVDLSPKLQSYILIGIENYFVSKTAELLV